MSNIPFDVINCLIFSLLTVLFYVHQKRKHTEKVLSTNRVNEDDMHLYSIVNKKRDTIVSYSSAEGVDFEQ